MATNRNDKNKPDGAADSFLFKVGKSVSSEVCPLFGINGHDMCIVTDLHQTRFEMKADRTRSVPSFIETDGAPAVVSRQPAF